MDRKSCYDIPEVNKRRERIFGPWKRVELLGLTAKYRNWEPNSCLAQIKLCWCTMYVQNGSENKVTHLYV